MYAIRHIASGALVLTPRGQLVVRTQEEATASPVWAHYTEQPGVVEIYGPVDTAQSYRLMTMQDCINWQPAAAVVAPAVEPEVAAPKAKKAAKA